MLNALYQFNLKYYEHACVSIVSLLENNKELGGICFYLLIDGIDDVRCEKLKGLIAKYNSQVVFIDTIDIVNKVHNLGISDYRGAATTNLKLLLSDYLPQNIDRIIYIDSDTIIMNSLAKLESFEMNGNPIAMVQDSMCGRHKRVVGFRENEKYYNGGVILFDMQKWKSMDCQKMISDYVMNTRSSFLAPDQDILNIVLKGRISCLPIENNLQPFHFVYPYRLYYRYFGCKCYYDKEEVEIALESPTIIHCFRYLGAFPWHIDSMHPNEELYAKYYSMLGWGKCVLEENENDSLAYKIERLLYRILPRRCFLPIFKVSYEFFMWNSNRNSLKQH